MVRAETFLVSMKEQTAQFGTRLAEFDVQTRKLEQQVADARPKAGDVSLANLRPDDNAHAGHVKADPAFPSGSEPNRIQFIAVNFGQERRTRRRPSGRRGAKGVVQPFGFNALAALVR